MGRTIVEKIFDSHRRDNPFDDVHVIRLDVVACHEITTPIAINDLAARGKDRVFDPDRIKAVIDHVTPAKDSKTAEQGKILRDWTRRHGIRDFFDIGRNGVCHALFPEKGFIRPGYTAIMGDSHTCTYGAFGAFAAGVGVTWWLMHGQNPDQGEASQFSVFWEAWHLVENNFLGDLPDMQHMTWGAVRGALATLDDPHTTFLEPQPRQRGGCRRHLPQVEQEGHRRGGQGRPGGLPGLAPGARSQTRRTDI